MEYYRLLAPLLQKCDAETAHNLAIKALRYGLVPPQPAKHYAALAQTVFGIDFPNPVGLAPGFDKNAEVYARTLRQGFGFVEVGTVMPQPQVGNDKPRMFRLVEDEAVINRFGFNNVGCEVFAGNLKNRAGRGIIGLNIGKNKDTEDAVVDYLMLLNALYGLADYITVNILPQHGGLARLAAKIRAWCAGGSACGSPQYADGPDRKACAVACKDSA